MFLPCGASELIDLLTADFSFLLPFLEWGEDVNARVWGERISGAEGQCGVGRIITSGFGKAHYPTKAA